MTQAFDQEFLKIAAPAIFTAMSHALQDPGTRAAIQRGLGGLGAGAGIGGLVGAGVGGVGGYREARREGAGRGEALVRGLGAAPKGAATGALVGGAGLGALEASGAVPGAYGAATKAPGLLGSAARFGQRQVHALTGWTPRGQLDPAGARQIGAGAAGAIARRAGATKNLAAADRAVGAAEKAESMGLTSLPGFARSFKQNGVVPTVLAGIGQQWHGGSVVDKALMAGVPAATAINELGHDREGRGGRLAGLAGQTGMMAFGSLPLAGSLAVGAAGAGAAHALGKLRKQDPALNHNPAPPETSPTGSGLAGPVERQYSDRATGETSVMSGAGQ